MFILCNAYIVFTCVYLCLCIHMYVLISINDIIRVYIVYYTADEKQWWFRFYESIFRCLSCINILKYIGMHCSCLSFYFHLSRFFARVKIREFRFYLKNKFYFHFLRKKMQSVCYIYSVFVPLFRKTVSELHYYSRLYYNTLI